MQYTIRHRCHQPLLLFLMSPTSSLLHPYPPLSPMFYGQRAALQIMWPLKYCWIGAITGKPRTAGVWVSVCTVCWQDVCKITAIFLCVFFTFVTSIMQCQIIFLLSLLLFLKVFVFQIVFITRDFLVSILAKNVIFIFFVIFDASSSLWWRTHAHIVCQDCAVRVRFPELVQPRSNGYAYGKIISLM